MKRITATLCVFLLAAAIRNSSAGMSEAQIKQAMKMIRQACQGKNSVSTEMLDGIQQGNFPDDKNLKLKNGKYKPDAAIAQAKAMLPDEIKDRVIVSMDKCRNSGDELVDGIQQGQFPDDRNLKCYIKCAMGMMQSMKGGKLKPEAAIQQAKMMLPDEVKGRVIAALETCRNAADGITDACDVAMAGAKCIYDTDPEAFIFP
ncbi:hypothetical protein C0J52_05149 [Blattella germanica]|nr:hypothetical protein C0J52_05149 [Blattella germanica]